MTGNRVGVEGTKSMSEMLKVNTALTSLDLGGEDERKKNEEKKEG